MLELSSSVLPLAFTALRYSILLTCAGIGAMSIYLGYRLFVLKNGKRGADDANGKAGGFEFRIVNPHAGTVMVAFGMSITAFVVVQDIQINTNTSTIETSMPSNNSPGALSDNSSSPLSRSNTAASTSLASMRNDYISPPATIIKETCVHINWLVDDRNPVNNIFVPSINNNDLVFPSQPKIDPYSYRPSVEFGRPGWGSFKPTTFVGVNPSTQESGYCLSFLVPKQADIFDKSQVSAQGIMAEMVQPSAIRLGH